MSSKPPEVRADILAHGFLPHDPEILIEAGLRCVSLLDSAYVGPGAAARLDVVIAKLRIHEPTPAASRAIQTFEEKLEKHRARERRFERAGCLALAIVGLGAVWLFVKLFVWIGIKVWP